MSLVSSCRPRFCLTPLGLAAAGLLLIGGCGVGIDEYAPPPSSDQRAVELPGAAPRLGPTSNELPGSKVEFITYGVQQSASDPGDGAPC